MRWPWQSRRNHGRLVIGSHGDALAWLLADAGGRLQRGGLLLQDGAPDAEFTHRVRALGLPAEGVTAVLGLGESQWLQVEAPAVKAEEMRAAARWRVKDFVEGQIDELTIDVMTVGDDGARPNRQLFVVAARNELIRSLCARGTALGFELTAIDVAETAQRNLLTLAAEAAGLGARATAALVRHGGTCLLTICAGGELYDARRLPWDDAGLQPASSDASTTLFDTGMEGLDFVDYGAMSGPQHDPGAPRLVIEVQRSFDVWERSWPALPLSGLWVEAGDATPNLLVQLARGLALPVHALEPGRLVPGFDDAAPTPQARSALLPLVGALRRGPERVL